jgi:hypothetical protein
MSIRKEDIKILINFIDENHNQEISKMLLVLDFERFIKRTIIRPIYSLEKKEVGHLFISYIKEKTQVLNTINKLTEME